MSEGYEPITTELRELMGGVEPRVDEDGVVTARYVTPEAWGEFVRRCDAIDAVHAALERENAELRERVAVLDNRSENMHDGGSITDELRAWIRDGKGSLLAIADRIDAEHEAALLNVHTDLMDASGWIRLPKDADGEYIHVGDVLDGYGKTIEVVEMRHGRSGWVLISRDGNGYADTFAFSHHHAPTVEDVLRNVVTLCHNTWKEESPFHFYDVDDVMESGNIADFAAKLRLAGDAS